MSKLGWGLALHQNFKVLTISFGDQDQFPCQHIRQAATRRHLRCVKHFWGLRTIGNPREHAFEKEAVLAALRNKDLAILRYLLYRGCPWDAGHVEAFFSLSLNSPFDEYRDLYNIAFKCGLLSHFACQEFLLLFMMLGKWDFLENIHQYGYTFEYVNTKLLALGPHGANVAALRNLHVREAFRTADLRWLTPLFAVRANDLPLLEFACELRPGEVAAAMAHVEDPAMREWLENHFNNG